MRLRLVAPRGSDVRHAATCVGAVVALAVSIVCAAAAVWPPAITTFTVSLALAGSAGRQHTTRTVAAAAERAARPKD
ncbi:hypothetical protein [Streptomyces sp. t39]|uniref:hypothetical protein n=1 Tax=Streptomyces sp. t39 TaxID=1828156 RepID=UPI0011CED267|nr:hypothetical protein [Streptomyces sp. t39]TXS35131.1 hypothetical protein EAO77_37715 [Streptomyces sp. t39]